MSELPDFDLFPNLSDPCTPADLVQHTPWARRTVDRKIAEGTLPAYRLGGRILIRKADVLALVEKVRAAG